MNTIWVVLVTIFIVIGLVSFLKYREFRNNEKIILQLLLQHGAAYGSQLIKLANGRLNRGSIYVSLYHMEEAGLIKSFEEPSLEVLSRKMTRGKYQLTDKGRKVAVKPFVV